MTTKGLSRGDGQRIWYDAQGVSINSLYEHEHESNALRVTCVTLLRTIVFFHEYTLASAWRI